jgi:hypothetical protein
VSGQRTLSRLDAALLTVVTLNRRAATRHYHSPRVLMSACREHVAARPELEAAVERTEARLRAAGIAYEK